MADEHANAIPPRPPLLRVGSAEAIRYQHEIRRNLAIRAASIKKPLTPNAATIYELLLELPEHRAMTGTQIMDALAAKKVFFDQTELTRRFIPELRPYGVENVPRIGYRIRPDRRPQK